MHSIRMRTARLLTISRCIPSILERRMSASRGSTARGVCHKGRSASVGGGEGLPPRGSASWGDLSPGGFASRGGLHPGGQINTCENVTLPQTLAVNIWRPWVWCGNKLAMYKISRSEEFHLSYSSGTHNKILCNFFHCLWIK